MADFCKQCAEELGFEPDFIEMFKGTSSEPDEGETGFYVLCETCGPECFIIDNKGTCGSPYCNGSLGGNGAHRGS